MKKGIKEKNEGKNERMKDLNKKLLPSTTFIFLIISQFSKVKVLQIQCDFSSNGLFSIHVQGVPINMGIQ